MNRKKRRKKKKMMMMDAMDGLSSCQHNTYTHSSSSSSPWLHPLQKKRKKGKKKPTKWVPLREEKERERIYICWV